LKAFPQLQLPMQMVPIYPAVTLQAASPESCAEVLGEFGIEGEFVLFVAAMRRHKNWEGALLGWANLPEELRSKHPLVLAGPNKRALSRMKRLVERLGVVDQVYITGNLDDRQLAALYTSCKLFLFPSYNEGFGLPPLEAMKCGAAVIAADAPAMPEVLGNAAEFVDPFRTETITAQLERVLTDADLEQRLRTAGIEQAATFNPERTGKAMVQLLETVLS
jgi:glycosyltransferase involved in cell wall biosynthesis